MRYCLPLSILLISCSPPQQPTQPPISPQTPISGRLILVPEDHTFYLPKSAVGQFCSSSMVVISDEAYQDIGTGLSVTVRNSAKAIIGTTNLKDGIVTKIESGTNACVFPFSLSVPSTEVYIVELGSRGKLVYSAEELAKAGGKVDLIIREQRQNNIPPE